MELKFVFDSENSKDVDIIYAIGTALAAVGGRRSNVVKEDVKEEDQNQVAEVAQDPQPEVAQDPQPKKRTRRKKEEPAAEQKEEPAKEQNEETVAEPEDTQSDLPFDNEPVNEFPKMTKDEWTEVNHAKRAELGLVVGGKNGHLIRDFNIYCQKRSELAFGNPKPSTLSEEELWQFAMWFKTIKINPDYEPGSTKEDPFVSDALSEQP